MTAGLKLDRSRTTGRLWILAAGLYMSVGGPIIRLADDIGEWQFLFYRALGATAAILVYLLVSGRPVLVLVRRAGATGVVAGLCLSVAFIGYVWGVMHSTVANALFLCSPAPAFAALLGWVVMREPVTRSMWFAMAGVIVGVGIMIGEGLAESDLLGDLASLSAAVGFAGFAVGIRRGRHTDMTVASLIGAVITMVASGAMAFVSSTGIVAPVVDAGLALTYGALIIGAGVVMLTIGARSVPAAEILVLAMSEVVLAAIWVWLAFGEVPSILTLVGGTIVLGSIAAQATIGMRGVRVPPR